MGKKDSPGKKSEKRTLFVSQTEEASESLRYPESNESTSEDSVTQGRTESSASYAEPVTSVNTMEGSMAKGCIEPVDENASELETRLGYFGLGLRDRLEVPEADKLLEVVGQIEGRTARILLDTGCSTYVLSSTFAERNGIQGIRMRPRPVDLAVSSAQTHLTHKTRPVKLRIGNTVITKSLYLLPIPQFDAIVGIPFFKENEIDLAGLETGIIKINGNKIPMMEDDMDMDMEESPENMETPMIGMISRKRLKKELKHDKIEELYLATIRQTNDDTGIDISIQDINDISDWIQKEYGPILREELSPQMSPT
jgi:hypothetical protein